MALLLESGCIDLTKDLDINDTGLMAVSGGGFADVYIGQLRTGPLVAIKCPRWLSAGTEQSRSVLKVSKMLNRANHLDSFFVIGRSTGTTCMV